MRLHFPVLAALLCLFAVGCARIIPPRHVAPLTRTVKTTAYCACGQCCGWRRNWLGQPVYNYGPSEGKPKRVGITSTGTRARHGTLASDPSVYPYGTVMFIPGYGYGRVEDCGGAIKGDRLDLFFTSHRSALEWGRRTLRADIWFLPDKQAWKPDLSQRISDMAWSAALLNTNLTINYPGQGTSPPLVVAPGQQRPTLGSLSIPCCGDDIADVLLDAYPELPAMLDWEPSFDEPVIELDADLLRSLLPMPDLQALASSSKWIDIAMDLLSSPTPNAGSVTP
jgi:3D (Asp-Asp-Asp) domain-containing protein